MERQLWLMYLHPDEKHNPNWWKEYGFKNRLEAYEYFVLKKKIIGLDAGWYIKENGEIEVYIPNRERYYKYFCLKLKSNDIVVIKKQTEQGCFEAILLVKDDKIFHHEKPIQHKIIQYKNNNWDISKYKRKDITQKIWKEWNVLENKDIEFLEYPYDEKVWFDLIRRVELLWYSKGAQESKIESKTYSPQGTLSRIRKENIQKRILKLIKELEMKKLFEQLSKLLKFQKQIILYGPPGTGKTYLAKQIAAQMLGVEPNSQEFKEKRFKPNKSPDGAWALVQFHPSYNYEDFVRGIKISAKEKGEIAYEVENRIFVQMCKEAWKYCEERCKGKIPENCPEDNCKKYVLIIDEINRANLAAVLGELIYALEYRGEAVRLPYEKEEKKGDKIEKDAELRVPPNLYIIGTMNTADRSIGHIDYAVRRRFAFVQVLPDEDVFDQYYEDTPLKETAKTLFKAVENLFKENGCLSPDYHKEDVQPGHSYFFVKSKDKEKQIDELAYKFAYQVWPLLKEYCKDGVLICEKCKLIIETEDKKFKKEFELSKEVLPKDLISTIKDLYGSKGNKSQSESSEKEEISQEESNKNS